LKTVDADFVTNLTQINDASSNPITLGSPDKVTPNANGIIMFLTNNDTTAQLFSYNTTAGTASNTLHDFTATAPNSMNRDANYYFFDYNNGIYRAPRSGAQTATEIVSNTGAAVDRIRLTTNRLVYQIGASIYAVDKNTTAVAHGSGSIDTIANGDADTNSVKAVGQWIFYTKASKTQAFYAKEDNTSTGSFIGDYASSPTNTSGAAWLAVNNSTTRSDEENSDGMGILLFTATSDTSNSIYSYTPGSTSMGIKLGDIANTYTANMISTDSSREGDDTLLNLNNTEAVYMNTATANSLVRVDDTNSTSDDPSAIVSP